MVPSEIRRRVPPALRVGAVYLLTGGSLAGAASATVQQNPHSRPPGRLKNDGARDASESAAVQYVLLHRPLAARAGWWWGVVVLLCRRAPRANKGRCVRPCVSWDDDAAQQMNLRDIPASIYFWADATL